MRILLIEDEVPARERLRQMIQAFDGKVDEIAMAGSIREALAWLKSNAEPDLMIVDIQLSDGLSFEIFESHAVGCPLIFATAYDEYILRALELNGIDYLLKPIKREQLHRSLEKYFRLQTHFTGDIAALVQSWRDQRQSYRSRLIVKRSGAFHAVKVEDIAFFYTEHKLVFLVERGGNKYVLDKPLQEIEKEVDPRQFFRLNRQYLAHIDAVRQFNSHYKGKLLITLYPPVEEEVLVSQERAAEFKAWIGGS